MATNEADREERQRSTIVRLPPMIMGGAAFSYQLHPNPASLQVLEIVKQAFALGLRAIDTSPYYEPSEELLGAALSHPDIAQTYDRSEFIIMTKCGRVAEDHFDYSASWIRKSVARSLERFKTTYLDVVFCHDVEFVTLDEAVQAVGALLELVDKGTVKNVGISGYDIPVLINVARAVREKHGKCIDVVQNWAHLCLQNTELESGGLEAFKELGVKAVCNASPLACGLLRKNGVPVGSRGDWHPAPAGLRAAASEAASWVEEQGDTLAALALRYAIARGMQNSSPGFTVATITGVGALSDLHENIQTAKQIVAANDLEGRKGGAPSDSLDRYMVLDQEAYDRDRPLYERVQKILGTWVGHNFYSKMKE
jgi:D-arabinose 1-dehydrogenase